MPAADDLSDLSDLRYGFFLLPPGDPMMHKIIAVLVSAIVAGTIAYAGVGTVNYTSSGTSPFRTTTDTTSTGCSVGTPCNLSNVVIFDPTTNTQGLAINASGQIGISNFPGTQPVSGTVTANQGTAGGAAWLVTGAGGSFPIPANSSVNVNQWAGTAITNVPTAVGTVGTGNTPTLNSYLVGCVSTVCNSNGQKTMANSAPVVIASDQSTLPTNNAQWGGTAITNTPTAVGTAGTGNTPTINAYIVGGGGSGGTSSAFNAALPANGTAAGAQYLSSAPNYTTSGIMVPLYVSAAGSLHTTVDNATTPGATTAANSSPVVQATDLASPTGNIAPNNTTAVVVNAGPSTVYSIQLAGIGSVPAYLKLYNSTSSCAGTPVKRMMIPAASTAANGAGSNITFPVGTRFSTGLTYCVSTDITDANSGAPAANTYLINIDWHNG